MREKITKRKGNREREKERGKEKKRGGRKNRENRLQFSLLISTFHASLFAFAYSLTEVSNSAKEGSH